MARQFQDQEREGIIVDRPPPSYTESRLAKLRAGEYKNLTRSELYELPEPKVLGTVGKLVGKNLDMSHWKKTEDLDPVCGVVTRDYWDAEKKQWRAAFKFDKHEVYASTLVERGAMFGLSLTHQEKPPFSVDPEIIPHGLAICFRGARSGTWMDKMIQKHKGSTKTNSVYNSSKGTSQHLVESCSLAGTDGNSEPHGPDCTCELVHIIMAAETPILAPGAPPAALPAAAAAPKKEVDSAAPSSGLVHAGRGAAADPAPPAAPAQQQQPPAPSQQQQLQYQAQQQQQQQQQHKMQQQYQQQQQQLQLTGQQYPQQYLLQPDQPDVRGGIPVPFGSQNKWVGTTPENQQRVQGLFSGLLQAHPAHQQHEQQLQQQQMQQQVAQQQQQQSAVSGQGQQQQQQQQGTGEEHVTTPGAAASQKAQDAARDTALVQGMVDTIRRSNLSIADKKQLLDGLMKYEQDSQAKQEQNNKLMSVNKIAARNVADFIRTIAPGTSSENVQLTERLAADQNVFRHFIELLRERQKGIQTGRQLTFAPHTAPPAPSASQNGLTIPSSSLAAPLVTASAEDPAATGGGGEDPEVTFRADVFAQLLRRRETALKQKNQDQLPYNADGSTSLVMAGLHPSAYGLSVGGPDVIRTSHLPVPVRQDQFQPAHFNWSLTPQQYQQQQQQQHQLHQMQYASQPLFNPYTGAPLQPHAYEPPYGRPAPTPLPSGALVVSAGSSYPVSLRTGKEESTPPPASDDKGEKVEVKTVPPGALAVEKTQFGSFLVYASSQAAQAESKYKKSMGPTFHVHANLVAILEALAPVKAGLQTRMVPSADGKSVARVEYITDVQRRY